MEALKLAKKLWQEESGQGMVEYGLILALVAIVVIGVLTTLGTNIQGKFQDIIDGLTPAP